MFVHLTKSEEVEVYIILDLLCKAFMKINGRIVECVFKYSVIQLNHINMLYKNTLHYTSD